MTDIRRYSASSGRKIREDNSIINTTDFLYQNQTALGQQVSVEPTIQFAYKSTFPLSNQRDDIATDNNGTVTKQNNGEIRLRATADAGSVAHISTKQFGDYIPNHVFLPSQAVRVPTQPTGNGKIQQGYFSYNGGIADGTFIEYNSEGIFHKVRSGGVEKYSKQLDVSFGDGLIFEMPFLFYGYGFAQVRIPQKINGVYQNKIVSTYYPDGELVMQKANMPLSCRVEGDSTQLDAYVAGRQLSTLGKDDRKFRKTAEQRTTPSNAITTSAWYPVISVKNKVAYPNIYTLLGDIDVLPDTNMLFAIFRNPTLTAATFETPTDYQAAEVSTIWDNEATAMTVTNSDCVEKRIISSAGGNKTALNAVSLPDRPIVDGDVFTFALKGVSSSGSATMVASVKENW